jgi:hypothetical protein
MLLLVADMFMPWHHWWITPPSPPLRASLCWSLALMCCCCTMMERAADACAAGFQLLLTSWPAKMARLNCRPNSATCVQHGTIERALPCALNARWSVRMERHRLTAVGTLPALLLHAWPRPPVSSSCQASKPQLKQVVLASPAPSPCLPCSAGRAGPPPEAAAHAAHAAQTRG